MAISSSNIDKEKIKEFEKKCLEDEDDIIVPMMDKTLTVNGFIKYMAEKEFRENYLKDKRTFMGMIYRVPGLYEIRSLNTEQLVTSADSTARIFIYKVRVPEIDGPFIELPDTFDGTPQDKAKIDLFKDYSAPPNLQLGLGDKVLVTYADFNKYKDGRILSKISPSEMAGYSTKTPERTAGQAFSQKDKQPPVTVADADEELSQGDVFINGQNVGKIKVKFLNISPVGSRKRVVMATEAANSFIKMRDEAAKVGIKLVATDGLRTYQEQQQLYLAYLKRNKTEPEVANPETSRKSPASHMNGSAVDINTNDGNVIGENSKIYKWLFENSPKFDFYNNGYYFRGKKGKNEPWHFQYAPAGSAAYDNELVSRARERQLNKQNLLAKRDI